MTPKVDEKGDALKIMPDGLVKLDGIPAFRKVVRDGIIYVQFCDNDRMRSNCRGTRFVEIPLSVLQTFVNPTIHFPY